MKTYRIIRFDPEMLPIVRGDDIRDDDMMEYQMWWVEYMEDGAIELVGAKCIIGRETRDEIIDWFLDVMIEMTKPTIEFSMTS